MDKSLGNQGPSATALASRSGFTSMTRSGVSMSSFSGSGSTRRGTRPALRRDMERGCRSAKPARRPDAQVSGPLRPAPNFLHVLVLSGSAHWGRDLERPVSVVKLDLPLPACCPRTGAQFTLSSAGVDLTWEGEKSWSHTYRTAGDPRGSGCRASRPKREVLDVAH